jgi:hypothetical protein
MYNPAAIVQGSHTKPPALGSHTMSRHSRHSSRYLDASETPPPRSPSPPSVLNSSMPLILVHDDEDDEEDSPLPFKDDEDEGQNDDDKLVSPMCKLRRSAVFPPLPPSRLPLSSRAASETRSSQYPIFATPVEICSSRAAAFRVGDCIRRTDVVHVGEMPDIHPPVAMHRDRIPRSALCHSASSTLTSSPVFSVSDSPVPHFGIFDQAKPI